MDVKAMFPLFSQSTGLLLIGLYALVVFTLTAWYAKGYNKDKESFLVANRKVGLLQGSMGVGASWIWAPGLFVAAQQGFNNGIAGVFWFSLGNFFSLILFSYGAMKIREKYGEGFTLSQWFRTKYGRFVQFMVLLQTMLYVFQAMTINLFAGGKSVTLLTGLSPLVVSILLTVIALIYSWRGGQKATIVTDMVKIVVIWLGVTTVAVAVFGTTGFEPVLAGIGGTSGQGTSLFDNPFVWGLFLGFGIPTVLGHLASSWTDNAMYQNAFSIQKDKVRKAFLIAPLYWTILPVVGGAIGMLAAGLGYQLEKPDTGFVNLIVMANVVGPWLALLYLVVAFAGIVSILDTQMTSGANLGGNDVHDAAGGKDPVQWGRYAMIVVALGGITLANIPGLDLQQIFVFGKSLSLAFAIPIVMALLGNDLLTRKGFIAGGAVGVLIGMPYFVYGQFFGGGNAVIATAVLIQTVGSGVVAYAVSKLWPEAKAVA